jgi:hypothetical protein
MLHILCQYEELSKLAQVVLLWQEYVLSGLMDGWKIESDFKAMVE